MSSLCSQLGNMLVKVRGSRPAWIRYALGGFFSFFSVETKWFESSSWVIVFFISVQCGWNCCLRMFSTRHHLALKETALNVTSSSKWEENTSTVLQYSLHGTLPVRVPADLCWAGAFTVLRPPALPQIHLVVVVHQEQTWTPEKENKATTSFDTFRVRTMPISRSVPSGNLGSHVLWWLMHTGTWLWSCIKVLLQERHGVDFLGVSRRVEKLHSSKLSWAAAQLVQTWCEVKPPWIWGSKVNITFTQTHQLLTLYKALILKNHISFCAVWIPHLATCSHTFSCPSCRGVPRILWALLPHHTAGWSPCCCCGGLPPEDNWRKTKVSRWLTLIAV